MKDECFRELCHRHDIKYTKHRKNVYNTLYDSDTAMTIEDIFIKLAAEKSLSLSTIYRILDVFVSKGLVSKNHLPPRNKGAFELTGRPHKHRLICMGCDKVLEMDNCPLVDYERVLKENTDFEIKRHSLEFFGFCPQCQKNQNR